MPLTSEQIDAAKAELRIFGDRLCLRLGYDGGSCLHKRITTVGGEHLWEVFVNSAYWVVQVAELYAALDRALSRAHLAEARRLGLPAWTLEELWQIRSEWVGRITGGLSSEFLTHLKSLPNA